MKSIDNQQAARMNEVFVFLLKNGKHHEENNSQFDISKDELSFIRQQICNYGEQLNLLVYQSFNDGDKRIVSFNKYECDQFMEKGGFEEYFNKEEKKEKEESERQIRKDRIDKITLLQKYWWVISLLAAFVGYFIAIRIICKC